MTTNRISRVALGTRSAISEGTLARRRLVTVIAGVGCTVASLVAPQSIASASTPQVAKPQPAICKYLDDQSGSVTFTTEFGKDIKTKNFEALQALLLNLVDSVEKMSTSGAVRSAPASVQAAIKTVAKSDLTVKSQIEKATTISGLEKILLSMGKAPGVHSAEDVLGKYADAVCGG
jgi:hypothetical protein